MPDLSRWSRRASVLTLFVFTLFVFSFFAFTTAGCSGSAAHIVTADAPVQAPHSFDQSTYDALLKEYVDERGMVDYARLKQNQATALRPYLHRLARTDPSNLDADAQLAFWINAYNALALKLVADNYPVSSIRDIKPSGLPFIPKVNSPFKLDVGVVGGKKRTLDEIEQRIIRKRFVGTSGYDEPRIHFALVCAAMSCPRLRREAYVGARLDAQLDDQARTFLHDEDKNRIPAGGGALRFSKILDWYGDDFTSGDASKKKATMAFAADYFEGDVRKKLQRGTYDVRYLDYDWGLNDQSAGGAVASGA